MKMLYRALAHESFDPETIHVFCVYRRKSGSYVTDIVFDIELDGEFFATAESRREADDEIENHIRYMGWEHGCSVPFL